MSMQDNQLERRMNERSGDGAWTRRDFVRTGALAVGAALTAAPSVWGSLRADDRIKVGLVGCGGRGTGAAAQALRADPGVRLWAVADAFEDRISGCIGHLTSAEEQPDGSSKPSEFAARVEVPAERRYTGIDCGERLIRESGVDVVLLCTPPHFRPMHLRLALESGKHVFCEKPMAVDAAGVRSVIESAKLAAERKLSLVSGFCWRYSSPERAVYGKLLDGALGAVRSVHATYHTSPVWTRKRQPTWSEMEFQLRNWVHFLWLGGDHIVEQACHSIDKIAWVMGDRPFARVTGLGGRELRQGEEYGDAYDHFTAIYEYDDGARAFLTCRQMNHCSNENKDWVACEGGHAFINGWAPEETRLTGKTDWRYSGDRPDMYQVEHNELFASIRAGKPLNDGGFMGLSTLMAIAGREAAYSGQTLTYDQVLASAQSLVPERYGMDATPPAVIIRRPGSYRFV
jgi:myo-inositol 2-dehydrogenase / D-chiro-inositol 1-dehydrogenase